jgi:hypothetical protein
MEGEVIRKLLGDSGKQRKICRTEGIGKKIDSGRHRRTLLYMA